MPKDMLDPVTHIVETKKGTFQPDKFDDRYEDALKDLIKKKQNGVKIEAPKERAPSNVVSLMDALRQSVKEGRGGGRRKPARAYRRTAKKTGRTQVRTRKRPRCSCFSPIELAALGPSLFHSSSRPCCSRCSGLSDERQARPIRR